MKAKHIIVTLLSTFIFLTTKAQHYNIAVGPEFNIPSGNSSNVSTIGLAAAVKAEIGLSPMFGLTVNASYANFFGQEYFGIRTPRETSVPLKAGFKYYTSTNFYVEGQIGTNVPLSGNADLGFVWSPGIGSYINLRNTDNKLDVGLRYEGWSNSRNITSTSTKFSTFAFIGLRVAYVFSV